MKALLTGGSGKLGQELLEQLPLAGITVSAPPHSKLDTTNKDDWYTAISRYKPDVIVHCAAYTGVTKANETLENAQECMRINGNQNKAWPNYLVPFVYISSDYVLGGEADNNQEDSPLRPKGIYACSKALGERSLKNRGLIIRTSFKPRELMYPKAWVDQFTTAEFVDVVVKDIALAVQLYGKGKIKDGVLHIGYQPRCLYGLIKSRFPLVEPANAPEWVPKNVCLDHARWDKIKRKRRENV